MDGDPATKPATISPLSISSIPDRQSSSIVFPQPLCPMMPTTSPRFAVWERVGYDILAAVVGLVAPICDYNRFGDV